MRKPSFPAALSLAVIMAAAAVLSGGCSAGSLTDSYPVYEQVQLDESVTCPLLKEKILGEMLPPEQENAANFCAVKVYSSEEISDSRYYVYTWVLESTYSYNGILNEESGSSYPCRFELEKDSDTFKVVAADTPGDGAQYVEDIKELFPKYVRDKIAKVQDDGTIPELSGDILRQAKEKFGVE